MSRNPSSVLVTGGTGFVGRTLVRRLIEAGHRVRVLSRRADATPKANLDVVRGDLTNAADVRAALEGCTAVFHCAAEKHDASRMAAVNHAATGQLVELCEQQRIGFFCHLSSVGVIGRTRLAVVDETTACHPMNPYERTKLAAEEIVARGLSAADVVILRPTNIFGVDTLRPLLSSTPAARLRLALKSREHAHFVYVEDVAAAAVHWLQSPERKRVDTFIVSSDEEPGNTHGDIQAAIATRVHAAPHRAAIELPTFVPHGLRLIRHGTANSGKLIYSSHKLRAAGFRFPFGLAAGLDEAARQLTSR